MRIKQHDRLKKVTFDKRKNSNFLTDSFFAQAIPVYSSLPSKIRLKTTTEASLKNFFYSSGKRTEKRFL